MLRSLFSGISGMRAHQQMLDVTGNNIANVNTAGYKASHTTFQDTLSQMIRAAGAPQGGNGGSNPAQIGLGVRLGSISTNFGQGAAQSTGRSTDLMIQGDGFFAVRNGAEDLYTRAGSFDVDAGGKLVTSDGYSVRGWMADPATGAVNTNAGLANIVLPLGTQIAPKPSTEMTVVGNLPGTASDGSDGTPATEIVTGLTGYDAAGTAKQVSATWTKTAAGWDVVVSDGAAPAPVTANIAVTFNADGSLNTVTPTPAVAGTMTFDFSGVTNFGGASTITADSIDGAAMGSLSSYTISPDGVVMGVFSNGLKQPLAQLAIANFNNPPGLEKVGGSMYRTSVNSGNPQVGVPGTGGRGTLLSGSLEMSNVDLAEEFTGLIMAQRGFQANSKVISTSDELLQELVNLKR